jgi:hypothetical protein
MSFFYFVLATYLYFGKFTNGDIFLVGWVGWPILAVFCLVVGAYWWRRRHYGHMPPTEGADMEMPPVNDSGDGPGAPANDDAGPSGAEAGAEAGAAGGDPLPPSQVEKNFSINSSLIKVFCTRSAIICMRYAT